MSINTTPSQLARLIGAGKDNSIMELIREYKELKDKLDKAEEQSVYFKWGIDNHRMRLNHLKTEYERARSFIDDHSAAELREMISEKDRVIAKVEQMGGSRFVRAFALQ